MFKQLIFHLLRLEVLKEMGNMIKGSVHKV